MTQTFPTLRAANLARQAEWDPDDRITLAYRGNEMGGECGEAQNVIKKLERERLGIRGSRATIQELAEELADVVICADLIAMAVGIDLDQAIARKFNLTSENHGLQTRLAAPPQPLETARANSFDVEAYVAEYEFRADGEGGCYTPNEKERALLIDAIQGALSEISLSPAPAFDEGSAGAPVAFEFPYQRTLNAISDAISFTWAGDSGKPHTFGISVERFQRSFNESTVGGEIRPTPVADADRARPGDLHTAIMDAIHGDLLRQNPDASVEEDGNATLAIPTPKAFLTIDVSSLAEEVLGALKSTAAPKDGEAAGHG